MASSLSAGQAQEFSHHSLLDRLLSASRNSVLAGVALLILALVVIEWSINIDYSLGVLYVSPVMLGGFVLNRRQLVLLAFISAFARGLFTSVPTELDYVLRFAMATIAYSGCGLFVVELRRNRQMYILHLAQLEMQQTLRREAEEQLRVLAESSPAAIMTLDEHGVVMAANRAAVEMLGLRAHSKLIGQSIASYIPIFQDALRWNSNARSFRTAAQCWGKRGDGAAFLAQTWFSTYHSEGHKRLAAIAVDVSDEMRDREEQHLQQLAMNNRILAGAVSHEIRNLCAAINVVFSNLQRKPGLSGNEDFAALGSLVSGLGTMASFELQARAKPSASFILHELLEKFLVVVKPAWDEAGGSIELPSASYLQAIRGEANELLQVLLNLSANSLRAVMESPEKILRITVSSGSSVPERENPPVSPLVHIRVCDSGPGVENIEVLFHPFQPGAQSNGLGLYVSRALMRNSGGDLRYETNSEGACFLIEMLAAGGT